MGDREKNSTGFLAGDGVNAINAEQLRLLIAVAVIATTMGVFTLDVEDYGFALVLQGFIAIPSLFLGLYVLFTAAHLKYEEPAEIGVLSIPEKIRRSCYDTGINLFWVMFLIFVIVFIAGLFGWRGDMTNLLSFWPSFIVSFVVLLLLMLWSIFAANKEAKTTTSIAKDSWRHVSKAGNDRGRKK